MSNRIQQIFQHCSKHTGLKQAMKWSSLQLVMVGILFAVSFQPVSAQQTSGNSTGSSHRTYRIEGIKAIPFAKLNANAQKRIKDVVNRPSFYRRLPVQSIDADPDYFRLLVRKPELIVSIWQLMGVTQMSTQRTGPFSVRANDGAGTISDIELIYGNERLHVFYCTGSYQGPLLKQKLNGRCVIVLQTQSKETATGFELTNVLDVYLRVDNATASLLTRTIQPFVGTTADHNFTESLKFVQRLNQSTRNNGPGVKGMGRKLKIDAQVRKDFESVVDQVFARATNKHQRQYEALSATRASASRQSTRPSTPRQVAHRAPTKVQAAKPQLSLPAQRTRRQPVVSPSVSIQTAQTAVGSRPSANTRQSPKVVDPVSMPVKMTLTDSFARSGVSVLVGGPRNIPTKPPATVSVADQNSITNSKFDPNLFPKRSTKR